MRTAVFWRSRALDSCVFNFIVDGFSGCLNLLSIVLFTFDRRLFRFLFLSLCLYARDSQKKTLGQTTELRAAGRSTTHMILLTMFLGFSETASRFMLL